MAFSKIDTNGLALDSVDNTILDLGSAFNFTGTLQQNGAAIGGNNTPNFWIYKSANFSVSTGTATKVAFDASVIDTGTGLGSNKWTVPSGGAGTYFVSFKYIYSGTWGARIIAYVYKNGGSFMGMQADKERVDGGVHVNGIVALSEGDYLEGEVYQDSGSTRDVVGGQLWCAMYGFKLL